MPLFSVGDRVWVKDNHPQAPEELWGRAGQIVLTKSAAVLLPERNRPPEMPEWDYMVRFFGDDHDTPVLESWIEPTD